LEISQLYQFTDIGNERKMRQLAAREGINNNTHLPLSLESLYIFVQDCANCESLPAVLKNENGRKAVLRKANSLNI